MRQLLSSLLFGVIFVVSYWSALGKENLENDELFECESNDAAKNLSGRASSASLAMPIDTPGSLLRNRRYKRQGSFQDENSGFGRHHLEDVPRLELVDIETYCFGNDAFLSLGPCSATFLKCAKFSQQRQYDFEECPLGEVFHLTRCQPAFTVKDCFNTEVNLLNDATEKLALATSFCARSPFSSALYSSSRANGGDHKCSRQALLCRNSGPALAISCPADKVMDARSLRCIEAPQHCSFVSNAIFAPIRENLLHLFCEQNEQRMHMQNGFRNDETSAADDSEAFPTGGFGRANRCKNWYVSCQAPSAEFVFCDSGKIFDAKRRGCRRVLAEDQCPFTSVCKGWEWRTVPLGECRKMQGAVFMNGHCRGPEEAGVHSCGICKKGDTKKAEKCEQFYFCQNHEITKNLHWQAYRCDSPRVYSPFVKECVPQAEYHCPNRIQCNEGDSFSTECGDFFYCYEGKYLPSKCPHLTRWDRAQRRCISDAQCHRFQEHGNEKRCQSGEAKPSIDCESYEECNTRGKWLQVSCYDFANSDRLKAACRFCEKFRNRVDTYPVDTVDTFNIANFNPFDSQGVRQKQCVDGEKIINKQDCDRYMECVDGEWFNLVCPAGYFFDSKTQNCARGGSVICNEVRPNTDFSSVYLPPLYTNKGVQDIATSGGPTPQIPANYKDRYENAFEFCEKDSPRRLPNLYDCSKFKECALEYGGYYVEKQCPPATQFDASKGECKYDYVCVAPMCIEGIREPRSEQCGKARRCRDGKWEDVKCKNNMAFINGKCSKSISCANSNSDYPHGGQCINQHTKPHYYECSKYLVCTHGQFVEESCFNGHKFNPAIGRCDPSYKCQSDYHTECYEGEMRPVEGKGKTCDQYNVCIDGRYEVQRCAFGHVFDRERKRCRAGNCNEHGHDSSNDEVELDGGYEQKMKCTESAGVDGFRADANDCKRFYQCAQGTWVPKECAANLAFNPSIGVCDWPRNVPGC